MPKGETVRNIFIDGKESKEQQQGICTAEGRGRGRAALKQKQAKETGGRTLLKRNSQIQRQSETVEQWRQKQRFLAAKNNNLQHDE